MPAVGTHYSFASAYAREKVKPYAKAFALGSQGPDPFFFYGLRLPMRKDKKALADYGTLLHRMDVASTYPHLLAYASQSEHRELLFAYIEGLFAHFSVDRACHPYIFYKAGCPIEGVEDNVHWGAMHCLFEGWLDFYLTKKYGTHTTKTDTYLTIDEEELRAISKMWDYANKMTIKRAEFDEDTFRKSVHDYRFVLRLLNRPSAFSKFWVGTFLGKRSRPYGLHMQKKLTKDVIGLDFLNENHAEWRNYTTGEIHHESFEEMFAKARADYLEVAALLDRYQEGEDIGDALYAWSDKTDHDGSYDGGKKRYRDPIWPDLASYRHLPE